MKLHYCKIENVSKVVLDLFDLEQYAQRTPEW